MLSQVLKYGLHRILANQCITQLNPELQVALGNAPTICLLTDIQGPPHLSGGFALPQQHLRFPQLADDLLRGKALPGHSDLPLSTSPS